MFKSWQFLPLPPILYCSGHAQWAGAVTVPATMPNFKRFFLLSCVFQISMLLSVDRPVLSQHQHEQRTWQAANGDYTVEATMISGTAKKVTLQTEDQTEIEVALGKLSPQDQLYANGWMIVDREQEQYDLVMPHIARYRESPLAVVEILHAIDRRIPDAPYAASMIGLAYASGKADYVQAEKYFRRAANCIKNSQSVLGPQHHAMTETAVRNNLAVCACKMGKGDKAIKFIRRCRPTEQLQFCLYHNATLILESQKFDFSNIRISSGAQRKLVDFLAQKPPANPEFNVPPFFLYLLEWNIPVTETDFQRVLAGETFIGRHSDQANSVNGSVFQTEKQLRDRGFSEFSQGTGFLLDSNLVITNRHVVKSKTNNLSYTITQFSSDGKPKLVGGSIIKWSPVVEQDLAMIRLDTPASARPLAIDATPLQKDDEVTVIGFPNANIDGEHILATAGFVEKVNEDLPWVHLSTQLHPGSSGSPCIDMAGNVLGVAFARESMAGKVIQSSFGGQGIAVDNVSLIEFVKSVKPDFKFQNINSRAYPNKIELSNQVRDSVFLIKSWMPPTSAVTQEIQSSGKLKLSLDGNDSHPASARKSRELEIATLRENRLYPDVWCPYCSGTSTLNCPERLCRRGKVERRKTVLSHHHPTTGDAIYRTDRYYIQCPTCSGKNHLECPHCDDGVMK